MPVRLHASVIPAALVWGREVLGMPLEVAATKIGVSPNRLQEFESGSTPPTVIQLRAIAKVYRRPSAFFYLETLPPMPERIGDFRALPDRDDGEDPELWDAVETAQERRRSAIELASLLGQEVPDYSVRATLGEPSAEIAGRIRDRLGIPLETQRTWREPYKVLGAWIAAAERAGVLVVQFSQVDVTAARGFSVSATPFPIIAINGSDSPRAKTFTLFHELAHVSLGSSGLCDLHDADEQTDVVEPFCNKVAAEALVPTAALLAEPLVRNQVGLEWEEWRLAELAQTYGISREVTLRRLLSLGRTTEAFYRAKREEYLRGYQETAAQASGFLAYFRRVLRDNGGLFTSLVLDAYHADVVTPTEVSRLLGGVKLRHLTSIEDALAAKAS